MLNRTTKVALFLHAVIRRSEQLCSATEQLLITIGCICRFFNFFLIYTLNKKLTYTPCYVLN